MTDPKTQVPPDTADEVKAQVDYFGEVDDVQHLLPDGKSFVTLRVMMEGERRLFLNRTNKDITIAKTTGDAKLKLAPGDERYELMRGSIIGWNLVRGGKPLTFGMRELDEFLEKAPVAVMDGIEAKIREINAWLGAELTIADIDNEIERLQELRAQKVEEERGKPTS